MQATHAMKMQPNLRDQASVDDVAPLLRVRPLDASLHLGWRRAGFVVPVLALPVLGVSFAAAATAHVSDALRLPLLALLGLNLLYMALTGWPGIIGFLVQHFGRSLRVHASPHGRSRTALVMPIYNEPPDAVLAAMAAMARAIAHAGLPGVDLFVLSDTRDAAIAAREEEVFAALQGQLPAGIALRYRRRLVNTRRKVGNIAEFCTSWGSAYDYMLVLDADSLMSPGAIGTLIGLMDANPHVGIVQSVPYPVGRETLFARVQQFAARLYTPMLAEGLAWWQQGDGNYWGHNAIIRIAPFRQHCELPDLPGREPWGGEILCHDVVEAGLMRAAGYDVWVLPEPMESFESLPANLVDYAGRERRWCQGNLQHIRLIGRKGLRPVGRFHLAYGVMNYLAAPVAAGFLALGTADLWLHGQYSALAALQPGAGVAAAALLGLTGFLLYGAKLLALGTVLADPVQAHGFGGRARLLASATIEQGAAFALTPIFLVFYMGYLLALVRGKAVRWDAQARDDRGVSWQEACRRLRGPFAVGVAWLLLLLPYGAAWLAWASPLMTGLLLAIPVTVFSSRTDCGRGLRHAGLMLTPEETRVPAILRTTQAVAIPEPVPMAIRPAARALLPT